MPPAQQPEQQNRHLNPPPHSGIRTVIGILVILTLLIFGALYFLNEHFKRDAQMRNNIPTIPSATTTLIIKE